MKKLLFLVLLLTTSFILGACGSDNEEDRIEPNIGSATGSGVYADDGSLNNTDVAVTGNVIERHTTTATIEGYVNMHLVTTNYTYAIIAVQYSQQEFTTENRDTAMARTSNIEGRRIRAKLGGLDPNTKYYYRTVVIVNNIRYNGEQREFVTNDMAQIIGDASASDITYASAKLSFNIDLDAVKNSGDYYVVGVILTKDRTLFDDSQPWFGPSEQYFANREYKASEIYLYLNKETMTYLEEIAKLTERRDVTIAPTIIDLTPNTTYYYCSYESLGTTRFGEIKSFTTEQLSISTDTFVDLGLSVKWASKNLDGKYAWGETEPKTSFSSVNYQGNSNLDAATNAYGNLSHTPSTREWQQLFEKCQIFCITYNGVDGLALVAPNGNTIFLPYGEYWTNTTYGSKTYYNEIIKQKPWCLVKYANRYSGLYIRPVSY